MDQHGVNQQSVFGGLMSDEVVSKHLLGEFSDFLGSLDDLDSSFQPAGQMSFSSTSGVDLSFKNEASWVIDSGSDFLSFFPSLGDFSVLRSHAKFDHEVFALIFM